MRQSIEFLGKTKDSTVTYKMDINYQPLSKRNLVVMPRVETDLGYVDVTLNIDGRGKVRQVMVERSQLS